MMATPGPKGSSQRASEDIDEDGRNQYNLEIHVQATVIEENDEEELIDQDKGINGKDPEPKLVPEAQILQLEIMPTAQPRLRSDRSRDQPDEQRIAALLSM